MNGESKLWEGNQFEGVFPPEVLSVFDGAGFKVRMVTYDEWNVERKRLEREHSGHPRFRVNIEHPAASTWMRVIGPGEEFDPQYHLPQLSGWAHSCVAGVIIKEMNGIPHVRIFHALAPSEDQEVLELMGVESLGEVQGGFVSTNVNTLTTGRKMDLYKKMGLYIIDPRKVLAIPRGSRRRTFFSIIVNPIEGEILVAFGVRSRGKRGNY